MPYRYWRSDVALGLLAIAALLGGYFVPLVLSGSDVMRCKDENARPRFATKPIRTVDFSNRLYPG